MKRTTSSSRPFAAFSISMSVTKPYLYFSSAATVLAVSPNADIVLLLCRNARAGARHEFVERGKRGVHIRGLRVPSKAHAQGASGNLFGNAHSRQHARGFHFAGRAGRARADADAVEIERHERRLGADDWNGEIGRVVEPWRPRAEDDGFRPAPRDLGLEAIAQARLARHILEFARNARRRAETRKARHVVRAAALAAFLPTAGHQRREWRAFLDDQGAGALRRTDLVTRQ